MLLAILGKFYSQTKGFRILDSGGGYPAPARTKRFRTSRYLTSPPGYLQILPPFSPLPPPTTAIVNLEAFLKVITATWGCDPVYCARYFCAGVRARLDVDEGPDQGRILR